VIDEKTFELLATESTNKGFTIPGVQKKLSLNLLSDGKRPRLTLVNYPTGYILKPQVKEFTALPESEHLVMTMAKAVGISTVPHALIYNQGAYAYITKRIDRVNIGGETAKLAMEDFCQLDLRLTADKYYGSYERCAKIISKYSTRSGLDMTELFIRLVFSFMIGNSDMHLKNFSLIETQVGSNSYVLSGAYDLLPVNVIMPEDKEDIAMPINGKKNNVSKKDFLVFADNSGIARDSAEKMIKKLLSKKELFIEMVRDSLLPEDMKETFINLISTRCEILGA